MTNLNHGSKLGLRFRTQAWLGGLAVWLLGCGPPTLDVHGRAIETRVSEDGSGPSTTLSWSGRTVEALSPDGSGYQRSFTEVDAQGEFFIPGVPAGPFWLAIPDDLTAIRGDAKLFAWTEARELDLGSTWIGSELTEQTLRQVPIEFTGLLPIQADDRLEAYSTGHTWSGTWGFTSLGATNATWPPGLPIRLRSEPGEQLVVKQWRKTVNDGLTVEAVVRSGNAPAPDATTGAFTIPLAEVSPRTLSMQVDHAAFTAELAPLPQPQSGWWNLEVSAVGLPKEPLALAEALLRVHPKAPARDANLSGLTYTDPYPASWARRYHLTYMGGRNYPVPNETMLRASCGTGFRLVGEVGTLSQGVLRPRMTLPQGLTIDGQDGMQEGMQIGASPTVRWRAPQLGQVSFYKLRVFRIAKLPDRGTPENSVASFLTTETEVNIPAGVLQPETQYFFELIAFSGSDIDATTAPRRASLLERTTDSAQLCSAGLKLAR